MGGVEELGLVKNLAPELCSVAVKEFVKQHSCGGGVGYRRVSVLGVPANRGHVVELLRG